MVRSEGFGTPSLLTLFLLFDAGSILVLARFLWCEEA